MHRNKKYHAAEELLFRSNRRDWRLGWYVCNIRMQCICDVTNLNMTQWFFLCISKYFSC